MTKKYMKPTSLTRRVGELLNSNQIAGGTPQMIQEQLSRYKLSPTVDQVSRLLARLHKQGGVFRKPVPGWARRYIYGPLEMSPRRAKDVVGPTTIDNAANFLEVPAPVVEPPLEGTVDGAFQALTTHTVSAYIATGSTTYLRFLSSIGTALRTLRQEIAAEDDDA